MDDFISREKAIEAIWKPKVTPNASIFDALRKCCEEEVKHLPAADVRPVVKSRWVEIDDYVLCANCGVAEHSPNRNYCHNCGFSMEVQK